MELIWNPDDYSIEDLIVILTEKVGKRFVKAFGLAAEKKRKREKKKETKRYTGTNISCMNDFRIH